MEWLSANAEWVFGGFGVAIPLAIIGLLFSKQSKSKSQAQKGGHHSINIQAGKGAHVDLRGKNE